MADASGAAGEAAAGAAADAHVPHEPSVAGAQAADVAPADAGEEAAQGGDGAETPAAGDAEPEAPAAAEAAKAEAALESVLEPPIDTAAAGAGDTQQAAAAPATAGATEPAVAAAAQGQVGGAVEDAESVPASKLFIGGVPHGGAGAELVALCEQHGGPVVDSVVMEGRGFGFVTFASEEGAQKFKASGPHVFMGKTLDIKPAVARNKRNTAPSAPAAGQPTRKIFVGGLVEMTDDAFRAHFAQFGTLVDCMQCRHPNGKARGFGFVTYDTQEQADACVKGDHSELLRMNGIDPSQGGQGSQRTIEVRYSLPRTQMPAKQGAGPMQGGGGPFNGETYAKQTGALQPSVKMRPGDWPCNACGNINFAFRTSCKRCNAPKGNAPGSMGGGDGWQGGAPGGAPQHAQQQWPQQGQYQGQYGTPQPYGQQPYYQQYQQYPQQQGYPQQGYPQQGYPQQGYPQQGYPQQGAQQPGQYAYQAPPGADPAAAPPAQQYGGAYGHQQYGQQPYQQYGQAPAPQQAPPPQQYGAGAGGPAGRPGGPTQRYTPY